MPMTRQHYQQIAEIIAELQMEVPEYKRMLDQLVAIKLRKKNTNFNEDRFLAAVRKIKGE